MTELTCVSHHTGIPLNELTTHNPHHTTPLHPYQGENSEYSQALITKKRPIDI